MLSLWPGTVFVVIRNAESGELYLVCFGDSQAVNVTLDSEMSCGIEAGSAVAQGGRGPAP